MSAYLALQTGVEFGKLFEPDALITGQFYDTTRRTYQANPELRLMAAVLEDAVAILTMDQRKCTKEQRRELEEALEWVNRTDKHDWLFSFASICDSLGINAVYLRHGLMRKIAEMSNGRVLARPKGRTGRASLKRKLLRLRAG
jgi:hypothetical protein